MKRLCTLLALALALAALAAPALAQQPDPYGEVLPGDVIRPVDGEVVVPPDDGQGAVLPGGGDRNPASAPGDVVSGEAGAPDVVGAGQVRAATSDVTPSRQLPVTGGQLTVALLVLGTVLIVGGAGAVIFARKRVASPQQ